MDKMMTKDIYSMKLHEKISITPYTTILRVPGGWIYVMGDSPMTLVTTFVPYNREFIDPFEGAI